MDTPIKLTKNQIAILEKLSRNEAGLRGRDFGDIATVTSGRWEWANAILKSLADKGFVQKSDRMLQGVNLWVITDAGHAVLPVVQKKDRLPAATGALTARMRLALKWTAESHPYPRDLIAYRSTSEALEARGLVTIKAKENGWRELRLTEHGLTVSNEIFQMNLKKPESPQEYSFDS